MERDTRESWSAITRAVKRRGRIALAVFAIVFLGIATLGFIWPKKYSAESKVIVGTTGTAGQPATTTSLPILNALLAQSGAQSTETYAELVKETPVAEDVISKLHLNMAPGALLGHIAVRPVGSTAILAVRATWTNPQQASEIANAFAQAFIARERSLVYDQANGAVADIENQIPKAHQRTVNAENALAAFETSSGIADLPTQTSTAITSAATLDAKLNATLVDRDQAEAQIASLSGQLAATKATTSSGNSIIPNPIALDLRTRLATASVQLADAQKQYTDEYPLVVSLKNQIKNIQQQLVKTPTTVVSQLNTSANPVYSGIAQQLANARSTVASDDAQIAILRNQRAAMTPSMAALPGQGAKLGQLQREAKLAADVENALQQKLNDATVARTTAIADASVVQEATASSAAESPNQKFVLTIAVLFGLILAALTVIVREFFDATVKDSADIERDLALPVLANIPVLPSGGSPLAISDHYDVIEAFLELVTALRYSSDKPLRTIAVTSPSMGDGKSTIALNTAKALGELTAVNLDRLPAHVTNNSEPRVLLVDADLRRPTVHRRLDLPNTRGLSDVLVGNTTIDAAIQRTTIPGLDVLTSGTPSPNPIKLLTSDRFDALLVELATRYATVIFDAPAVTAVLDAAVIALKVDGTVMIVSAGATDTHAARRAVSRLESVGVTNLLGSILNRSRDTPPAYDDYIALAASTPKKRALAGS